MRARARRARRAALAALAALALAATAGCGFHLRGATPLPPVLARTHVATVDRYTDFSRALDDALRVSGVTPVAALADATAVVEILEDESVRSVLSVSARNTPREYEVRYTVRYRVRAGDAELLPPQSLTLTRDYSFDETALLAKEREQEQLREALARELAALVMRRLAALPPAPAPTAPAAPASAPATPPQP